MNDKFVVKCLIQEYLNLKEGTIVEQQGIGYTRFAFKASDSSYQIIRSDHELKRRFVFLGIEQIPDIFSGGSIVLLKDVRDNFIVFASKWLWIDENKIVYMFWQNENYGPRDYIRIIT